MSLHVDLATDPATLDEVFRLRHEIFAREGRYFAERPDSRFFDRFDACGGCATFVARQDGELIATVRVTLDHPAVGLASDPFFDFRPHIRRPDAVIAVANHFCCASGRRGALEVVNRLLSMGYYWCRQQGVTHLVAPMNLSMRRLAMRGGFRAVVEEATVPDTGLRFIPMVCAMDDVRSSFAGFAAAQDPRPHAESYSRSFHRPGETILEPGSDAGGAYLIVEGTAREVTAGAGSHVLGPGSLIGCGATALAWRQARVSALTPVTLMPLARPVGVAEPVAAAAREERPLARAV